MFLSLCVLFLMIVINGFLSMTEMSVVSSKKAKIRINAQKNIPGYKTVEKILLSPTRFLSTIQIGITFIGIIAGAFGEARISERLELVFQKYGVGVETSEFASAAVVILLTTLCTILLGEIVPKRIAMSNPEKIASIAVYPVKILSLIFHPFVRIISILSDLIFRVLPLRPAGASEFEEEELRLMLREGENYGHLRKYQADAVESILELDDDTVSSIMIPRPDISFIDISLPHKKLIDSIIGMSHYQYLLVCQKSVDHIVGVVKTSTVVRQIMRREKLNIPKHIQKPAYFSEKATLLKAIETFNGSSCGTGIVLDEYGSIIGLVTQNDIMTRLFADKSKNTDEDERAVKRKDGSYIVDAMMPVEDFAERFGLMLKEQGDYNTVAGLILSISGHIPKTGETLYIGTLYVEIIDMDGKRIDKILVKKVKSRK